MSQIRVNDITDSGGSNSSTPSQIYSGRAKAWVNFNGQGTVAIRGQYNVSSISDNGTGYYTVNFSSAFPDTNYAAVVNGGTNIYVDITMSHLDVLYSTGSFRFSVSNNANKVDASHCNGSFFR